MNAPVLVAQLAGSTPQTSAPPKNLKLEKPQDGQALSVHLDGNTRLDFSDISSEKLTFVRIGERLIVLFDNHSTVTVDPVFDSLGRPLADVAFEMTADRTLTGEEFASLFPITTDQSVLPAAGTPGAPGIPAGAHFGDPTVDPLSTPTPLDLLGPEESTSTFSLITDQGVPNTVPTAGVNASILLNEDAIPGAHGNPGGPGDVAASYTASGVLSHDFQANGPGTIDFAAMNGTSQTINGIKVTFTWNAATDTLTGNDGTHEVFQLVLTDPVNGNFTVTLENALLHHTDALADNVEGNNSYTLTYTVHDSNGDSAVGTVALIINDDTPVATDSVPAATSTGEGDHAGVAVLPVNEADATSNTHFIGNQIFGSSNTTSGTLQFSPGADGLQDVTFASLNDTTAAFKAIYDAGNGVAGQEAVTYHWTEATHTLTAIGDTSGSVVFTLQIDDTTTGHFNFELDSAVVNPGGDLSLVLPFTVTDGDGDQATANLTIAVTDDAPIAEVTTAPTTLDDDAQVLFPGNPDGQGDVPDATTVSGVAGTLFNAGADGFASISFTNPSDLEAIYKLPNGLAGQETLHYATTTDGHGDTILTATGDISHNIVFTLTVGSDGSYTFVADEPLVQNQHDTGKGSPISEIAEFVTTGQPIEETAGVTIGFTVTDGDGDQAAGSLTVNVNDDTPVAQVVTAETTLDDDAQHLFQGNPGGIGDVADATSVSAGAGTLFSAGADGLQSVNFTGPAGLEAIYKLPSGMAGQETLDYSTSVDSHGNTILTATGDTSGNIVFTLTVGSDGSYTFVADEPLVQTAHDTSNGQPIEETEGVTIGFTVTDGDGDQASGSLTVNVNDDTPSLTLTAPAALHGLDFGTFDLNNNAWGTGSGLATGSTAAWTIGSSGAGGSGAVQLERVGDGYEGMHSSTNGFMVDLDASPHDVQISQTLIGLAVGQTYDLRFEAGAPFPDSAHLQVWFGGQQVFDLAPSGQMQQYEVTLTGGFGDGSNLLEFRETGTPDDQGTYLANISVGDIVIDETAGINPGTNETTNPAIENLFSALAAQGNPGTDPDMLPQFAVGTGPAVTVAANFGADGPAGMAYALATVQGADSGLETTAGKEIFLFNETYSGVSYVVGRYDSTGDGAVDSQDNAAFAFRVDPTTGALSIVQYVSLHQPDTSSNNEGVFLNANSLSVSVTITDGDGDTATQQTDISAGIRFDDDGPKAAIATTDATLIIDETAGIDLNTNDIGTANVPAVFAALGAPIEIAQSHAAVVSTTGTVYGADGQGVAPVFALSVSALNGVDSGIDATDGRSVFLFKEGDLIVGREGNADGTVNANGNVAFAISLDSSTGVLSVAQYTGLHENDPTNPNDSLTFPNGNVIQASVTVTDGDGDTSVASIGIGNEIHFLDDGPTVAAAPLSLIVNGDFTQGVWSAPDWWGSSSTNVTAWTLGQSTVGPGAVDLERSPDGYLNMHSSTHGFMIDMGSSPGNIALTQSFNAGELVAGQSYAIQFEAGAPFPETAKLEVMWDGQVIGTIDPSGPGALTSYNFIVTANGTSGDVLTFMEVGTGNAPVNETWDGHDLQTEDYHGTYLANIALVAVNAVVDEDGLTAGNHDLPTPSEGDTAGIATSVTGALGINWGADNYDPATDGAGAQGQFIQDNNGTVLTGRNVFFTDDTVVVSGATNLTSNGDHVVITLSDFNTVMTATATDANGQTREVFQVSLSDDGSGQFKFVLLGSLDQAPNGSENDLDLTFNYTATDSDGDTVTSTFSVGVNDDIPVAFKAPDAVSVNEAGLTGNPSVQAITGFLNVHWGADDGSGKHLNFAPDSNGHFGPSLTSGGIALDYVVTSVNNGGSVFPELVAYKDGHPDQIVFTITLYTTPGNDNPYYTFALFQPIDQPGQGADTATLNFNVTATDADGDTVALSPLSVSIVDDVPHPAIASTGVALTIDETAGIDANTNDIGIAHVPAVFAGLGTPIEVAQSAGAVVSYSGTFGADGQGATPAFSLGVSSAGVWSGLSATDGQKIYLYEENGLVVGREGTGTGGGVANESGALAFAISIDSTTGITTIAEYTAIHHSNPNDPNEGNAPPTIASGALLASVTFTDGDGDHVTSTPVSVGGQIQFLDDGPTITAPANLITNGSFEADTSGLVDGQWSVFHSVEGWTSVNQAGIGDVPFELQVGGVGGMNPEDGHVLVELDSDTTSGNLPGTNPNNVNTTGHTNSIIQQIVAGTEAGQTYELTFWYSPRAGEGDANSGSLNVLWNGQIVQTIDSSGLQPGWQQIEVFVEGTGPNNTIAFQATGQENSLGALIDNVSLIPMAVVDEDGLVKGVNGDAVTGNHDSQPGDAVVPNNDNAPATGGDSNESTSTGLLAVNWGADNYDAPDQYSNATGFTQDGVGRSLTFTNTNVGITGNAGTALTSHGDTVTFALSADKTEIIGTATDSHGVLRTVIEISLSDDGTGAFHVVLKDALDHAPGNNENDIVLSFNYTATDSDGDSALGSFSVLVDDDVPVLTGTVVTGSVSESDIGGTTPVVKSMVLDFQHDTINSPPNLTGTNLQITGGTGIAVVSHDPGVYVLQGPDAPAAGGATSMFITATAGTTFTLNSLLLGTFGTGPNTLTLIAYDAAGHEIGSTTFTPTALGYVSQEPTAAFTAFSNLAISKLEIDPPASGFSGRIVIDNLSVTETTTPAPHPAETVVDLTSLVSVGADAPGAWSLSSFSQAQNVGSLTYNGTQITMTSDGHTITGVAGGITIFTMALSTDGHATFDLFQQIDGGTLRSIDFSQFITVTDDDGDSVKLGTGEFVINVNSTDHLPTVSAAAVSVNEAGLPAHDGLPAGSHSGDGSNIHSGTIAITLGDTPSTVTIGTTVVTVGETFQGSFGTLHIDSVSSTSIGYTYTLTTNTSGDTTHDAFTVTVTDDDGSSESASTTLTINITDDVPTANPDTASVTEGQSIGGNVIAGDTSPSHVGADTLGADGATVTAVSSNNVVANNETIGSNGVLTITGAYGTLTLNPDGSYSYVAHSNISNASPVTDTFTYTLTDGDGDHSTATLSIAVGDGANPTVAGTVALTVDEAALDTTKDGNDIQAGLVTGSNPTSTAETDHSNGPTFTAHSDNIAGIGFGADGSTVTGITVSGAASGSTFTWVVNSSGQLEGHIGSSTGPLGIILSITGNTTADANGGTATPTITATLTDDFPHAAGSDSITFTGIQVVATDTDGSQTPATISVTITDDVPTAHPDTASVTEGQSATGNVIVGAGTTHIGADTVGADGATITAVSSSIQGHTETVGAGGVLTITGAYGALTLNPDGSYSYTANSNISNHSPVTDTFTYTLTDGDGDTSSATLTISVSDGASPTVSGSVALTIDEAALDTVKDPTDIQAGLVNGSSPASTAETQQSTGLTFTAHSDNITGIGFGANGITVSGAASGSTFTWVVNSSGQLEGHIGSSTGPLGIILSISGTTTATANGGTATPTITATLTDDFPHAPGSNPITVSGVQVIAADTDGSLVSSTIGITITDDVPTAHADAASVAEGSGASNVILIIDTSGSVDGSVLASEKAAAINLLNAGINGGQVLVVGFSDGAQNSGWVNVATAINYINGLHAGGNTNYDAALQGVESYVTAHPAPAAAQTVAYFLSDGAPNEPDHSVGINSTEQGTWDTFLASQNISTVYGVKIGSSNPDSDIAPIAYPSSGDNIGINNNPNGLVGTLPSVAHSVTGNVLTNDVFGADGHGAGAGIQSIKVGAVTYTFDATHNTFSDGQGHTTSGSVLTVSTSLGTLTFYFAASGTGQNAHAAGDYVYSTSANVSSDQTDTFHYTIIDGDGDTSGADLAITIKNSPHAPTGLNLASADDSGSSNSDDITNHTTGLTISGAAENGTTVTIFDDANGNGQLDNGETVLKTGVAVSNGAFTTDVTLTGPDATHHIVAFETDSSSNTSPGSTSLDITIDTTAPAAVVTGFINDSGVAGDHITNDKTLTVTGTAEAGSTVTVFRDHVSIGTTTADSNGNWSETDQHQLSNGNTYQYTAQATDVAGNTGAVSANYAAIIDTSISNASVHISAIANDTGSSSTDFITNDTSITVSGTHGTLASDERIQVSSDGGHTWADVTTSTATTWSYTDPASHTTSFTYEARVVDTAGNIGNDDSQNVTIDLTPPTNGIGISDIFHDTGVSSSDFITNDTKLTVEGTYSGSLGSNTIQISTDGGATWTNVTNAGGGDWSYNDPTTHTNGPFTYEVRVVDIAGNVGNTDSQQVTIDTAAPTVAVAITDASLNDGHAASNVTITFSEAPVGFTSGDISTTNGSFTNLTKVDATHYTGTFTATNSVSGSGSVTVGTGYTDTAGNTGVSGSDSVTIDTKNPTVTSIVMGDTSLLAGETSTVTITFSEAVTGFISGDVTTPNGTLSGLTASNGGVTWTGTFTPTADVHDTSNVLTVQSSSYTDLAGNLGSGGTGPNYVVDTIPPPVFSSPNTASVNEGVAARSTVYAAVATNADGESMTYSLLSGGDSNSFSIDSHGVVSINNSPNFETKASYTFTVQATETTGESSTEQVTLTINDLAPSTPVDNNVSTNTVVEGAANGSTVGVTASSTDVNGPAVTYSLVGDTSGGGFTINSSTGVVTVADHTKIDFEGSGGSYTVVAQASDGTMTSSQAFVIHVTDVAPTTPVDSNVSTNTIAEGAANGSTVGVTASSTDVNGPAVTYSLVGDTSGGGFTINAATGVITVADSSKIDYESAAGHAYTVTAQASDGTLTSSQTFTIAVTDVAPSTPVDSNNAANTVVEGAANGTTVGITASSTDINGPAVTYSLIGDTSGGGFTINSATGVISVADGSKINYETAAGHAYAVTAQASDGTLTSSQTFTIAVSDVAPTTPVDSNAAGNTVVEGAANGTTVGVTASSTDVNGPAVTYALVGDTSGGGFTINSSTGVVTVADSTKIDFENSGGSYTVVAQASDGTLTSSQAFVIAVTDVAPTNTVPGTQTVMAGANLVFSAANSDAISVSDPNGTPTLVETLTVSHGTLTLSTINGLIFTTGDGTGDTTMTFQGSESAVDAALSGLKYVAASNYSGSDTLTVVSSDGTLSHTDTVAITVQTANHAPVISSAPQTVSVVDDFLSTVPTGNVVHNGGFETNPSVIPDWTGANFLYTPSVGSPIYAHSGAAAVSFVSNGAVGTWTTSVATVAGVHYTLDFWAAAAFSGDHTIAVSWNGETVLADSNVPSPSSYPNSSGYTEYSVDVVGTGGTSNLVFSLNSGFGSWYLDDVSMTAVVTPGTEATQGTITFTDADVGDTHTVSVAANSNIGTFTATLGTESSNNSTGTVNWTFSATDAQITALVGPQQSTTETYTVTINDGHGGVATQNVTVDLTNPDHVPQITSGAQSGAVTENLSLSVNTSQLITDGGFELGTNDGLGSVWHATHSGSGDVFEDQTYPTHGGHTSLLFWTGSDAPNDVIKLSEQVANTVAGVPYTLTFFVANDDGFDPNNFIHVLWNNQTVLSLSALPESGFGSFTEYSATLMGTGTTSTLEFDFQNTHGYVFDDVSLLSLTTPGTEKATGVITFTDPDIDPHTVSVAPIAGASGYIGTLTASIGTDSINGSAGTVNWTYSVSDSATASLGAGQSLTQTYVVSINDGHGGVVSQDVTITINGSTVAADTTKPVVTFTSDSLHSGSTADTFGGKISDNATGTVTIQLFSGSSPVSGASTSVFVTGGASPVTWSISANTSLTSGGGHTAYVQATDASGNVAISSSKTLPAGVAGSDINLALADYSDHSGMVSLTVAGLAAGWALSEGTQNADGSWTVQTHDIGALSVTSPDGHVGALVLNVSESWTNADGTHGTATVADNVEAYAKGSPIFAWSGDDTLTASIGSDTLVFANQIGNDVVHNFDTMHDKIDLIGFNGFASFADVQAHLASDASGNAVITLGDGETITLNGIAAASLNAGDFEFDQTPVTTNTGDMVIGDGALLPLSGVIENTGSIHLASAGNETDLEIVQHGATFQGGGTLVLSDNAENVIFGSDQSVTLTNVDNTISGAGHLGDGQMTLVNEGSIIADGINALDIDTGGNTVINSGTLEATGAGGLTVHSDLVNDGLLWANGGNVTLDGDVSGHGSALISGNASLEIGGAFGEQIQFDDNASGTLKIDNSVDFHGILSGFGGHDAIDLGDILASTASLNYTENAAGTGGTLTVNDGSHTANIALNGLYASADFHITSDSTNHALIQIEQQAHQLAAAA